jgi:hypothetical protein
MDTWPQFWPLRIHQSPEIWSQKCIVILEVVMRINLSHTNFVAKNFVNSFWQKVVVKIIIFVKHFEIYSISVYYRDCIVTGPLLNKHIFTRPIVKRLTSTVPINMVPFVTRLIFTLHTVFRVYSYLA